MKKRPNPHPDELHRSHRSNWLRAAVLGANDGIVSVASIMIGVATAQASDSTIMTAGIAGIAAGALSMAAGEYVSVSSQKDSENADIDIETRSLQANPDAELAELTHIYEERGLNPKLAKEVAIELHNHDAVSAHLREELGIYDFGGAKPAEAAIASAVSFTIGGIVPIIGVLIAPAHKINLAIVVSALIALAISGAIGARLGGGNRLRAASRVLIGGSLAMAITALIGHLIGLSV